MEELKAAQVWEAEEVIAAHKEAAAEKAVLKEEVIPYLFTYIFLSIYLCIHTHTHTHYIYTYKYIYSM